MTLEEKLKLFKDKGWTCDPVTGNIFNQDGKKIDYVGNHGYISFNLYNNGGVYHLQGHQVVWFYATGNLPTYIDHINHIKTDNRIVNLRDVNNSKNQMNRNPKYVKGYSWHKRHKKFYASIKINNKSIPIGYYDIEAEARQAYLSAKSKYHII